jgi:hypothetical protein
MGDAVKHTAIDVSDVTVHWSGWVWFVLWKKVKVNGKNTTIKRYIK